MDKAKAAIGDFMHKAGHNDTTVHENVAPAVVHENITKTQNKEVTTAIDKEVHQDHFHTTVQPVKDREVLPEQHQHQMVGVEHREHHHGDQEAIKRRLEQERLQFQNERTENATRHTESQGQAIVGEHVHHHIHETIQPVVEKEIIQPSVVHTTVPVHEVHHKEAKHHAASALPAVSMAEFQRHGGALGGREERVDAFEGEPKAVGSALGGSSLGGSSHTGTHGTTHGSSTSGPHDSSLGNKMDPRVDSDRDGSRGIDRDGSRHTGSTGPIGTSSGGGYGSSGPTGTTGHNTTGASTAPKHSSGLMNKLDPRVDSNNDGKAGFGK